MQKGMSVVLPSYLEAENLKVLLPKLNEILVRFGVDYEILVIDTVSPMDDTPSVCKELHAQYVSRENGNSYGDAVRTGIKKAKYDSMVFLDADGSHDITDISKLYEEKQRGYDIAVASRYAQGGKTDNNFVLRAMSYALNLTYSLFFGIKVKDISTSFKIYDAVKLKSLDLKCSNFDIIEEILILWKSKYKDTKWIEIPSHFKNRNFGKTKRNLFLFILSYGVTIIKLSFRSFFNSK